MSSSVGHSRNRRPSLHTDWTTPHEQHYRDRSVISAVDNRIQHNIDYDVPLRHIWASYKDIDNSPDVQIVLEHGQRLYEAFEPSLRARGLTVNDVQFYLEKSSTAIPENADAIYLAGHKIFVRGRGGSSMKVGRHTRAAHSMDESNERSTRKMSAEAVSRKSSFVNSRLLNRSRNHPNLNGSDDAECRSNDSSLSVRDISQFDEPSCSEVADDGGTRRARSVTSSRISLFFGKEKNEMNEMVNRLNLLKEDRERGHLQFKLESDWREIVKDYQELSEKSIKQQEAIWEIITTEHRYIKLLRYMNDLSKYLLNLQSAGFLKDIENHYVFINFDELLEINSSELWHSSISPILEKSRETGEPLDVSLLWNGFVRIREWSQSYLRFNLFHGSSHSYLQKKTKENEQFREFVMWAESQENLERQKLCDILSQPMQRLTRYNLLLKALLKVTTDEAERELIKRMICFSENATHDLNLELNNNDLRLKLSDIGKSIEGYECIDHEEASKLLNGGQFLLKLDDIMPLLPRSAHAYRTIYHRGDLKMTETKKGSKTEIHCMLFTDMFLICRKLQGKKERLKLIKPPIHITKLLYHPINETSFDIANMTEFNYPSALYMMYTSGYEETQRWLDMMEMARTDFIELHHRCWSKHDSESPTADYGRGFFSDHKLGYHYYAGMQGFGGGGGGGGGGGPTAGSNLHHHLPVIHRKCSSMDSQAVAAHAHLNYMHHNSAVCSTEQLDRHANGCNMPPRHKLSVASCIANPLSSSKSSVDLYVSLGAENENGERPRSRSNSSGPDIEGINQRSRSSSPVRLDNGKETPAAATPGDGSPVTTTNTTPCRDSPTLLITPDDSMEPTHSGRRFEKRYHTADGIDVLKPKGSMLSGAILKRFSWNVSSAVGGSSRKRMESSRRSSQASTAASMDSFGSSTSGISTASSSNNEHQHMAVGMAGMPSMSNGDGQQMLRPSHISTIAINDTPFEPQPTLSINLDATPSVVDELDEDTPIEVCAPPPPDLPPPSTTPSPNSIASDITSSTPSPTSASSTSPQSQNRNSSQIQNQSQNNNDASSSKNPSSKHQELLKFILDNQLETSDV